MDAIKIINYPERIRRFETQSPDKPLPPYGKTALERIRKHSVPLTAIDLRIYTGAQAWDYAKPWQVRHSNKPVVLLPPEATPESFDWSLLVYGLEPWVIDTGECLQGSMHRLALVLLLAGADVVRLSSVKDGHMHVYQVED